MTAVTPEQTIQSHVETRGTVFEVRGSFGPAEVERVREMLRGLAPGTPVTIDFREVRLLHDLAVARLARELAESVCHVNVLGLSEHHHRLLRYIGLA